jgi:hypothetical protein
VTIDDLKFVRLTQPQLFTLIPRYLFEQVKGASFIIERVYELGPAALANPLTLLYVLAEKKTGRIKGVLWAEVNLFNDNLVVHVYSVDKEYQGNGTLAKGLEFIRLVLKGTSVDKIQMSTNRPKAFERKQGWSPSEQTIMELDLWEH